MRVFHSYESNQSKSLLLLTYIINKTWWVSAGSDGSSNSSSSSGGSVGGNALSFQIFTHSFNFRHETKKKKE